jgi:hypothetical protein
MAEIWAIAAAAVVAAGATAYSAQSASSSAAKANQTNQDIANANNQLNYQMFLQSRGSQGNALLPMYLPSGAESNLAAQAYATSLAEQASLGTPADQLAGYQSTVQSFTPAMDASGQLVNQLFSGQLAQQQQANIAPVLAARGEVAGAQKTGILEGLMQRLNALSADRARAGYTGGGSAFEKNLLTSATIPALQGAATVGAQADLANATDVAAVKNQNINTQLQNVNLPLTQAANRIQLAGLPTAAVSQNQATAMQPLDWFKLNPGQFTAQRPPLVQPVANVGQIVGTGVAQGASTMGNFYANQQLINQLQQNQQNQNYNSSLAASPSFNASFS